MKIFLELKKGKDVTFSVENYTLWPETRAKYFESGQSNFSNKLSNDHDSYNKIAFPDVQLL